MPDPLAGWRAPHHRLVTGRPTSSDAGKDKEPVSAAFAPMSMEHVFLSVLLDRGFEPGETHLRGGLCERSIARGGHHDHHRHHPPLHCEMRSCRHAGRGCGTRAQQWKGRQNGKMERGPDRTQTDAQNASKDMTKKRKIYMERTATPRLTSPAGCPHSRPGDSATQAPACTLAHRCRPVPPPGPVHPARSGAVYILVLLFLLPLDEVIDHCWPRVVL